jgi:hypothetical protein
MSTIVPSVTFENPTTVPEKAAPACIKGSDQQQPLFLLM